MFLFDGEDKNSLNEIILRVTQHIFYELYMNFVNQIDIFRAY